MAALSVCRAPCCSEISRSCCDDFRGFSQSVSLTPIPHTAGPRPLCMSTSSRHRSLPPRSFFQEGNGKADGPSATNDPKAELRRKLSQSSQASHGHQGEAISLPLGSLNIEDGPGKEENKTPSYQKDGFGTKHDDGDDDHELGKDDTDDDDGHELEDGYRMTRVCDRLIEVFLIEKTTPEDWRKLLAFSKEWRNIRTHFFKRCKARAEQELDPKRKGDLLKLSRKLKEVDDDMERHNELLAHVKEHGQDLDTIVARRRKDFTNDFFQHLELLYQACYNQADWQHDLASIAKKCLAAVEAHDKAAEDVAAISAAQMKFDEILNSPSLDIACNKIDELAKRNELDSTLMLLITNAWAASKESNMMKEEVKDILYHLYMVARGNMQRLVPKEVRIMRHVLSLEDPKEQFAALTEAFSPGAELEGKDIDLLYTTPEKLQNWIVIVLDAYYHNKRSTLMQSAQQLMNPMLISRLEILKKTLEDQFL